MLTGFICVLWFAAINAGAFLIFNKKKSADLILTINSLFLLIYKTIEYIYYNIKGFSNAFPVEFSAISYFLFSIVHLFRIKKLEQLAVFCAFISGFFYMLSIIFVGDGMFKYNGGIINTLITLLNHSLLYFGAIIKMKFCKYNSADFYKVFSGMFFMIFYAWALKPLYVENGSVIFIYKLMDASIINMVFPAFKGFSFFMPIYYLIIIVLCLAILSLFYKINRIFYYYTLKAARKAAIPVHQDLNKNLE